MSDVDIAVGGAGAVGVVAGAALQFGLAWVRARRGETQDEHDERTAGKLLEQVAVERAGHRADIVFLIAQHRDEQRELRLTFERGIAMVVSELKAAIAGCQRDACPWVKIPPAVPASTPTIYPDRPIAL